MPPLHRQRKKICGSSEHGFGNCGAIPKWNESVFIIRMTMIMACNHGYRAIRTRGVSGLTNMALHDVHLRVYVYVWHADISSGDSAIVHCRGAIFFTQPTSSFGPPPLMRSNLIFASFTMSFGRTRLRNSSNCSSSDRNVLEVMHCLWMDDRKRLWLRDRISHF